MMNEQQQTIDTSDVIRTYLTEVGDHLAEIESLLLALESEPDNKESLNSLFRSFHTIKGTSEMFGYRHITEFTHTAETLLSRIRSGEILITPTIIDILLKCRDHIAHLLELSEPEFRRRGDLIQYGQELQDELAAEMGMKSENGKKGAPAAAKEESGPSQENVEAVWQIQIKLEQDLFFHGLDPYPIIRYLKQMGEILRITTDVSRIPSLESFDPEKCYLGFTILYRSRMSEKEILDNFEFIKDDSAIEILRAESESQPESHSFEEEQVAQEHPVETASSGGVSDEQASKLKAAAATAAAATGAAAAKGAKTLRVESERIDSLINLLSELVMSGAVIHQQATGHAHPDLIESSYQLSRLISDIRDNTLRLRMVPVGGVFNRFKRVVHDLAKELKKEVVLYTSGDDTELDKSVIEQIGDPLMHLVRNALDHGIESPDERVSKKKERQATLLLNAYNEAGDIIIEIIDDGRGLDLEGIRKKAISNQLISSNQNVHDSAIANLIFEPGLSNAKTVTQLSGRGVGLDVVKRNIESLNGSVEVNSLPGKGTTFRIKLPLTLATIDGFLVRIGSTKYLIPLDTIHECVERTDEISGGEKRNYINLRGEVLPYVSLRELFVQETSAKGEELEELRDYIVVVRQSGKRAGLLVDELMGEIQSVIKPLSPIFGKLQGINGLTILGTGEVAFILDVHSLITLVQERESSRV